MFDPPTSLLNTLTILRALESPSLSVLSRTVVLRGMLFYLYVGKLGYIRSSAFTLTPWRALDFARVSNPTVLYTPERCLLLTAAE